MVRRSVLLLASHRLDWGAVRDTLRGDEAVDLTEVTNSGDALRAAASVRPDVVILPAAIEGRATIDLIRAMRSHQSPESRVVVFVRALDEQEFAELVYLGVVGIVFWRDLDDMNYRDYLRALILGSATVYSLQADRLWREMHRSRICLLGEPVHLTRRELAILRHLYAGLSRHETAEAEGISERTVKREIERLMEKLDAHHQFILGAKAALLGFVP